MKLLSENIQILEIVCKKGGSCMKKQGIFEVPECSMIETEEKRAEDIVGGKMSEVIVGSVASGVSSAVAGVAIDSIPGPAIPG